LQIKPADSLTPANPENNITPVTNKQTEYIEYQDKEKNKQVTGTAGENNVHPAGTVKTGTKTRVEQEAAPAISTISGHAGEKPLADVPAQPATGNILIPAEDNPVQQQAVNEDVIKDTVVSAEFQLQPPAADADSVKPLDQTGPGENPPGNPATNPKQDNAEKQTETGKVNRSAGMSENLSWQIGINGNIGEVVQKERDPNMFYGVMVTVGLWNEKLKGGIETGVGYEVYEDYGSVTENIRFDSIPTDTSGNFQYLDSTRITAYKYQYAYLQVPLFVAKQLVSKGRFSLDIKTGPVVGFMISDRKTLDFTSGPTGGEILSTVKNDYSRLKISWQWQLMPQLRWNLNKRFSLSLSPYGIFYLNNLYDKKNRPDNMPVGLGVYGGLIYKFK
jgi:hypothetical protein